MKRELRDKVVAMCRSGEYKQGKGRLTYIDQVGERCYCVDGLVALALGYKTRSLNRLNWTNLAQKAGLTSAQLFLLWIKNDNGCSFPMLADYIEEYIPVED